MEQDNTKLLEYEAVQELVSALWSAVGLLAQIGCGEADINSPESKQFAVNVMALLKTFQKRGSVGYILCDLASRFGVESGSAVGQDRD